MSVREQHPDPEWRAHMQKAHREALADLAVTYCGCCGRDFQQGTDEWCIDCLREHIDTTANQGAEDRTWFAQYGTDCPFREDVTP